MKSYFASYRSSAGAEPVDATVLIFDTNLNIGVRNPDGTNVMINWLLKDVEPSFDFSAQQSRLRSHKYPGAELIINGNDASKYVTERHQETKKPWYKKSSGQEWIRNSVLLIAILGGLFLLYLLIVPWLSQKLATKVSVKTEEQLGEAVYDALQLSRTVDTSKTRLVNAFFYKMEIPTAYDIRISVVKDHIVNAFALPGGRIIVYTGLLDEIESYPELAALLSHEFTHINNKHSTKSIFRRLGSKVFLGLLFGRFGSVTSVVVDHAERLRFLKYSRRLEKEADLEGLKLLLERQIEPGGFEDLLRHLQEAGDLTRIPEFLGSHPNVNKRVAYIREAAAGSTVKEHEELKAIFEKIKN